MKGRQQKRDWQPYGKKVKEEVTVARLKQETEEAAERERIAANQFSLFRDLPSDLE